MLTSGDCFIALFSSTPLYIFLIPSVLSQTFIESSIQREKSPINTRCQALEISVFSKESSIQGEEFAQE